MIVANDNANQLGDFDELLFSGLEVIREAPLLRAKREEAFGAYSRIAVPSVRLEEWRRTDPSRIPFNKVRPLPALHRRVVGEEQPLDEAFDVVVAVDEGGYTIKDRTGAIASGAVDVCSLAESVERYPDLVQEHLQGEALPLDGQKFVALNGAFWNVGFFIHVAADVHLEHGILIRYELRQGGVLLPRYLGMLEARSEASIVEYARSADDASCIAISAGEFYVSEAAHLRYATWLNWGQNTFVVRNDRARVERDGSVDWVTLNLGGKLSKINSSCDLAGEGARAEMDGLFFADGKQHVDQATYQVHSAPRTFSRLLYRGAVADQGHSVYQGTIQAKPGAVQVDAYQTNNNLLLSDGARADTIPGLLIDADDLKCSHGATIGNLDEEQIFYLQSRGLREQEARRICVMGFLGDALKRIPVERVRKAVAVDVEQRVQRAIQVRLGETKGE